jgi:long-chain fatty acid transport protein
MLSRGSSGRSGRAITLGTVVGTLLALTGSAHATEGYFQNGYGARGKALAGAGVADSKDATAISNNPAGLVDVDDQTAIAISLFSPQREYEAGLNGPITPGLHESDNRAFAIPNFAWTHRLAPDTVLGVGVYGNGGMDTRYPVSVFPPFGRSPTGVDLNQVFVSAALAHRMGKLSVGVAPVVALQVFQAQGLGTFAAYQLSSDPDHLSDIGNSFSYGGGVKGGVQYELTDTVRVGVAGATRMWMTDFDKFSGLFAEHGNFDIPANVTAGVAVDVSRSLTLMFDYKHIWYSDIPSIAHSSGLPGFSSNGLLGSDTGPGFGWHDVDVFKIGAEWRYDPRWTLRAGYSYNTNPIKAADVAFNILAPGIVQHHISAGAKYKWSDNLDLELAGVYVPETSVSGTDPFGFGQPIEIRMHQYEVTAGIVWHWDGGRALEPLK